jgi:hypothetical protein
MAQSIKAAPQRDHGLVNSSGVRPNQDDTTGNISRTEELQDYHFPMAVIRVLLCLIPFLPELVLGLLPWRHSLQVGGSGISKRVRSMTGRSQSRGVLWRRKDTAFMGRRRRSEDLVLRLFMALTRRIGRWNAMRIALNLFFVTSIGTWHRALSLIIGCRDVWLGSISAAEATELYNIFPLLRRPSSLQLPRRRSRVVGGDGNAGFRNSRVLSEFRRSGRVSKGRLRSSRTFSLYRRARKRTGVRSGNVDRGRVDRPIKGRVVSVHRRHGGGQTGRTGNHLRSAIAGGRSTGKRRGIGVQVRRWISSDDVCGDGLFLNFDDMLGDCGRNVTPG